MESASPGNTRKLRRARLTAASADSSTSATSAKRSCFWPPLIASMREGLLETTNRSSCCRERTSELTCNRRRCRSTRHDQGLPSPPFSRSPFEPLSSLSLSVSSFLLACLSSSSSSGCAIPFAQTPAASSTSMKLRAVVCASPTAKAVVPTASAVHPTNRTTVSMSSATASQADLEGIPTSASPLIASLIWRVLAPSFVA
mmetsp:Transcript_96518/g.282102  ORF Transcript_96518/g.282102 Transcript_96518/m.282102 type:complete len:200 (-) Transcript_96518:1982-2581(-)